jgi:hypothetical protein
MAASPSFRAGDLQCVPLTDGELPFPAALLLKNAPPDELARALGGELDPAGCDRREVRSAARPRPGRFRSRRRDRVSERFLGRAAAPAAVESFLDAVPAGAALELSGDPGIGKTALWSDACERARRRGYRVLASRPGEFEPAPAYGAVGDLLEDVLDEALLALPPIRRSALERAVLCVEDGGRPPDQRAVVLNSGAEVSASGSTRQR